MTNRKQPFGYHISGGRIAINNAEADIVKYIFHAYTCGSSYSDIKSELSNQPVAYDIDKLWNKNMIARILGDRRYVGTDVYPPILSCEEFEIAESVRSAKVQVDVRTDAQRLLYKLSDKRPTVQTEADVLHIINALIRNPRLIKEPQSALEVNDTSLLQQQFDDLLLIQPIDEAQARQLAFQIASAQYSAIDNSEYETERLRRLMLRSEPTDELDADLLSAVVDKVIVDKAHTQVVLKNGQEICSEEAR